jgi:hypothetical protein
VDEGESPVAARYELAPATLDRNCPQGDPGGWTDEAWQVQEKPMWRRSG